eukprot:CAMPEP_0114513162 /NCGR_PEP_ID=MMETSP0109-20121206/15403_1 /TAXON_ID=29199 /ORGANISM="Chlorarachnion reptans, Strain CCCM449" /LENGTH=642 /DNA_ID=CAMNT_0001692977 /DNA_START=178 /DNA_END=2106 /DNA_ORIENTATION=-
MSSLPAVAAVALFVCCAAPWFMSPNHNLGLGLASTRVSRQASGLVTWCQNTPDTPSRSVTTKSSKRKRAAGFSSPRPVHSLQIPWGGGRGSDQIVRSTRRGPGRNLFTGIGLLGKWDQIGKSYVLRPKRAPKSVIIFVGGAFVGAAPQQWYRYLLELLSDQGHVVVTTPYQLDFNYLSICKKIARDHEKVYQEIKEEYGDLPVIGMGHSAGSLLHSLLSTNLTNEESFERSANIFISFNNKPVKEAIPAFEQLVTPAAVQLTTPGGGSRRPPLIGAIKQIQNTIRGAQALGDTGLLPPIYKNEIIPFVKQSLSPLDQLPGLFERIADGVSDFTPSTPEIQQAVKKDYAVPASLLIQFSDDTIDETPILGNILDPRKTDLTTLQLPGTHVTPCVQDLLFETPLDVIRPRFLNNFRGEVRKSVLQDGRDLAFKISDFIDDSVRRHQDSVDGNIRKKLDKSLKRHVTAIDNSVKRHQDAVDTPIRRHKIAIDGSIKRHKAAVESSMRRHGNAVDNSIKRHEDALEKLASAGTSWGETSETLILNVDATEAATEIEGFVQDSEKPSGPDYGVPDIEPVTGDQTLTVTSAFESGNSAPAGEQTAIGDAFSKAENTPSEQTNVDFETNVDFGSDKSETRNSGGELGEK